MHHCLARRAARLLPAFAALLCACLIAGCGSEEAKQDTTPHIGPRDVLGKWQLTRPSIDLLVRDGFLDTPDRAYTITFTDDGWLKFDSVLDDVKGGTLTTCLGTWRILHDVTIKKVQMNNVVELQILQPTSRYFLKLSVKEEDKSLKLWHAYGEAKALETLEYERPGAKPQVGW